MTASVSAPGEVIPNPAAPVSPPRPRSRTRGWPWLLGAAVGGIFLAVSWLRYDQFRFSSWDLTIFVQAVQSYARGDLPVAEVRGGSGYNLLGDHFSPALAVVAPGWWLWSSPLYLLAVQAACFGFAVVPLARCAERLLGTAAAACVSIGYVLSWGLQQAVVVDFHEAALAVPLVAGGCVAVLESKTRAAVCWLLPLLLVKEDLGLTVAAAGACLAFRAPRPRPGLVLLALGSAGTLLTMGVLIPAASGEGYRYAERLQVDSPGEIASRLFTPGPVWQTVLLLLGITAFAALRSPLVVIALPTLAWRFAADQPVYWGHEWHYSAVLMPIVFVAGLDGLVRLRNGRWRRGRRVAPHLPAVVLTIGVLGTWIAPLGDYLHAEAYRRDPVQAAARQAVTLVPAGSIVETDIGLMSHLAAGRTTYFVGNGTAGVKPDFVVLDQRAWGEPMQGRSAHSYVASLHPGETYDPVFERHGITVLRHRATA